MLSTKLLHLEEDLDNIIDNMMQEEVEAASPETHNRLILPSLILLHNQLIDIKTEYGQ